jgi:hypothetical protein
MKEPFKFKAVFARTTTDKMKSKIHSMQLVELVLDCYMKPDEFARLIKEKFEKEMIIEIK